MSLILHPSSILPAWVPLVLRHCLILGRKISQIREFPVLSFPHAIEKKQHLEKSAFPLSLRTSRAWTTGLRQQHQRYHWLIQLFIHLTSSCAAALNGLHGEQAQAFT